MKSTTVIVLHDRAETSVTTDDGYVYISQISIDGVKGSIRIPVDSIESIALALRKAALILAEEC